MCEAADDPYLHYQQALIDAGLLIPCGVKGVYGRSGLFEQVVEHFERFITRMGAHLQPEVMRFPPIFSRTDYLRNDHIETMPDLMGSVHSFCGNEQQHRQMVAQAHANETGWTDSLNATEVMMVPAACYPLYPTARGILPSNGRIVDLRTFVFRHEPSDDPARMQIFRQREYVRLGSAQQARQHRDDWLQRAQEMLESVGLPVKAVLANDPFFGRGGRVMKATQREQALKYELVVPICSADKPTAITSCNYHLDHFGLLYAIKTADGACAHTACIGFGLERIALALFKYHGFTLQQWPAAVKKILDLA